MNGVNTCAYYLGEPADNGLLPIFAFARERGIELSEVLRDGQGSVASFRRLQDLVKLGLCQRLIVISRDHIGSDEWMRLENELFFKRNGVKVTYIEKPRRDCRYRLANAVKLYYSPCHSWSAEHGDELPPEPLAAGKRSLPLGYTSVKGAAEAEPILAPRIRRLFAGYAQGRPLTELTQEFKSGEPRLAEVTVGTVNNLLANERYLGSYSPSGYRLPGVISCAEWFAACSRRLKKTGAEPAPEAPYLMPKCVSPTAFRRGGRQVSGAAKHIDSDKFEQAVESAVYRAASCGAERFYNEYVLKKRQEAADALPSALQTQAEAEERLAALAAASIDAAGESDTGRELAAALDNDFVSAMRVRRIKTELELFSLTLPQIEEFFKRASSPAVCTREEKRFFASAFIKRAVVNGRGALLLAASPVSPEPVSISIPLEDLE